MIPNPWDGQGPQPVPGENPATASSEWTQALERPEMRAALLSAGLSLMTPQWGQTTGSAFAQAIGSAGETLDRRHKLENEDDEAQRKRDDTDSQIQYRADQTENRSLQLANQERDIESKAALRSAQSQITLAKIGQIQAIIQNLEMKTALAPGDQQAKIELQQARAALMENQAALAAARTEAVAPVAASQVTRNNAAANLAEKRAGAVDVNTDLGRRRVDATEKRNQVQETIGQQRIDATNRRTYQQEVGLMPPSKRPSFEQWMASRGGGATPPVAAASPPAAPVATPTPALSPAPAIPAQPATPAPDFNEAKESARVKELMAKYPDKAEAIRSTYRQRSGGKDPI